MKYAYAPHRSEIRPHAITCDRADLHGLVDHGVIEDCCVNVRPDQGTHVITEWGRNWLQANADDPLDGWRMRVHSRHFVVFEFRTREQAMLFKLAFA